MTGVVRDILTLLIEVDAVLASGQGSGAITAARLRQLEEDLTVSVANGITLQTSTSYANDAAAQAGGVQIGGFYRNGNFIMVRVT